MGVAIWYVALLLSLFHSQSSVHASIRGQLLKEALDWRHVRVMSFLHCSHHHEESIKNARYLRQNFQGLMSTVELSEFNVGEFDAMLQFGHVPVGVALDCRCPEVERVLRDLSKRGYFNLESFSWFLLGTDGPQLAEAFLQDLNFTVSLSVTVMQRNTMSVESFSVFDAYAQWIEKDWQFFMLRIGMWHKVTGFQIWDNRSRYQRRRILNGIDLKGIRLQDEITPIEFMKEPNNIIALSMWSSFAQIHNISISTIATLEKIGLILIKANKENIQNFDYSAAAAAKSRTVVLFQHPQEASTRSIFLRPFSLALWLAIGAVFILVGLMIRKAQELQNKKHASFTTELLMVGVFCQQGFVGNVDTVSVRIMVLSVLIFTALLYQFYIAHIVGYLLMVQPKQMKSLEQLLENAFDIILEDSDEIVMYKNDITHKRSLDQMNVTQGMSLIKSNRKAIVCDQQRGYSAVNALFSDNDRCRLQEIVLFPEIPLHLALPKGSPYKDLFRVTLLKIIEHGVMQYEQRRWFADKPECAINEVKMPELNLDQTASVFQLVLIGVIGSMVVLLLEILINRLTSTDGFKQ
ncbi:uncharacterized protein LOC118461101 isoform X2 [Anopheles albimanus]|uniref:Ionotropic glutamate receptor C-terminal domain-containing protein n=1 Tax=Anopheles albimanus TaxID=7167 RepID=A0A8W7JER4_ANOAL|nr:uncharacterized protein LOC118461101 isoform X2 [Anopheles albimanus]